MAAVMFALTGSTAVHGDATGLEQTRTIHTQTVEITRRLRALSPLAAIGGW
jgi:hypothetical protein